MARQIPLMDQVNDVWAKHKANGHEGLKVLDKCINRLAKSGDWDALSRFVVLAHRSNNTASKVKRILRVAFGDKLKFKLDKNHATGGRFTLGWKGDEGIALGNSYSFITKAIQQGLAWDDKGFLKSLNDVLPEKEKAIVVVDDKAKKAKADRLAKFLASLKEEGFNVGEVLAMAQAEVAKNTVAQPPRMVA